MTREEFAQGVLKHKERLWGYALQLTHSRVEAEDLIQLTYLRAFESWEQLRDLQCASRWLIRTMHRAFVDKYRRSVRLTLESLDEVTEVQMPQSRTNHSAQTEARDALTKAMVGLAPALSQALALRDVWGFSYEEIAELMECPIGTVRSRIARARAHMLDALGSEGSVDAHVSREADRRSS